MKNNDEFRRAVFEKAAEYEKQRKIKRQKALRAVLSVCVCLAVFIAVGAVPFGLFIVDMDEAATYVTTAPDNSGNVQPSATTTTEACTATASTTPAHTYVTTEAHTYATTAAYTYATTTTAAHTYATAATTRTSTTAGIVTSTTAALSTTGPIFPEQLLEDRYYNGVMTLHVGTSYGEADYCNISSTDIIWKYEDLSDDEAKYFSEDFFERNALIRIKYTLGNIGYRLDYKGMQAEDGKITVFLELDKEQETDSSAYAEWEVLIPVPRERANGKTITADVAG